jgi:hypothetical protein
MYVRWPDALKSMSIPPPPPPGVDPHANDNCNAMTCPSCPDGARIPQLKDKFVYVPIYEQDLFFATVRCFANVIYFEVEQSSDLHVTTSSDGVRLEIRGGAGYPAVHCENGPDLTASGLSLVLSFRPQIALTGLFDIPSSADIGGSFDSSGGWELVDLVVGFSDHIKSTARAAMNDELSTPEAKQVIRETLVDQILNGYIQNQRHHSLRTIVAIETRSDGIFLSYIPGP